MSGVKAERLLESVEDAGDFFVRKQAGKSEAGVIVDGDVQAFHAGTWIAASAIAGGADAGLGEAAQLLDVEVKEFAGLGAFSLTLDRRFGDSREARRLRRWRFRMRERVDFETSGKDRPDLSVGAAFAAQGQNAGFELRAGLARLMMRDRGAVPEAGEESLRPGRVCEPLLRTVFGDGESGGGGAQ